MKIMLTKEEKYGLNQKDIKEINKEKTNEKKFLKFCNIKGLRITYPETFINTYYYETNQNDLMIQGETWIKTVTQQAKEYLQEE
jgi:nicotinamide mononucleotide adenylyltransferase